MKAPDFLTVVARSKLSAPNEWEYFRWERVGDTDDVMVSGGIPRLITRGPRKGKKTWDGKGDQVVVTRKEAEAAHAAYELETGLCHVCGDTGQQWDGWSVADGHRYETCRTCNGTGKATGSAA